jgi:hypothetical protein
MGVRHSIRCVSSPLGVGLGVAADTQAEVHSEGVSHV